MKKLFLIMLMALMALLFGSGCSAIPKKQQLAIAAECGENIVCVAEKEAVVLEEIAYKRQERLDRYVDEFHSTSQWCSQIHGAAMQTDWHCRGRDKNCPPKRIHDRFQCVDVASFMRQIQGYPF